MIRNPQYTKAGSLPIKEVGRKIRASRARLAESPELGGSARAWAIWAACMERTASWSKGSDIVHVVTIANMCNLRPDKVSPILRKFDELGVFGWTKETGRKAPGVLSLPSLGAPDVRWENKRPQPKRACEECGSTVIGRGSDSPDNSAYRFWWCENGHLVAQDK